MVGSSSNVIGVTKCGTIWCLLDIVGTTSSFKGGGSLLEVQAGVSEKDLILVGEVTGGMSFRWGELSHLETVGIYSLPMTMELPVMNSPVPHQILILIPWYLPMVISFRNVFGTK